MKIVWRNSDACKNNWIVKHFCCQGDFANGQWNAIAHLQASEDSSLPAPARSFHQSVLGGFAIWFWRSKRWCLKHRVNETKIIEGSLNSKLPTIWTVEKQSRVVRSAERRCNSAKVRRKKIHPRQMLEKSRNAVFFQWFVCRVSPKVGLLKRRVRRYVFSREIKNCTPLRWKAHFEVKMLKNWRCRSTFWSSDVEKLHAAVAKSTFWSQNVKKNWGSGSTFLKFWCRKIARRCGEKHILKSKC